MGYVINFVSGPSVGKSLISALVYAELKIGGYTTEYVQEYAKQLVWLRKWDKLNNQYLVSSKQYELIKVLYDIPSIKYVVVDGGLMLGLYYNRHYKTNVSNVDKTEKMIISRNNEFKNIYIHLERNPEVPFEQDGRVQTYMESLEVDKSLKGTLRDLCLEYKSFRSSKDSIEGIVEYIKSKSQISV
jgi:hypothetical protein